MKVKTIFASMVVLGLVSGTAFAAQQRGDVAGLLSRANASSDAQASKGDMLGGHVKVGAQLNIDGQYSNRTADNGYFQDAAAGGSKSSSDLDVNNSNVSFDVKANNMVNAHVELTGAGDSDNYETVVVKDAHGHDAGTVKVKTGSNHDVRVDEAYVTVGDLKQQPFYLSVGRMYRAFGYYGDANPLTKSFMQQMSESNGTTLNVGYAQKCGLGVSGYIFKGKLKTATGTLNNYNKHDNLNNGGLDASFKWCDKANNTGFMVGAGYINNIVDTEAFAAAASDTYAKKLGGMAVHANGYFKQFDASVTYVGAMKKAEWITDTNGEKAKASSIGGEVGYGFKVAGHESRIGLGYQRSSNAIDLSLPKSRAQVDWTVGLMKNTNLQMQFTRDADYSAGDSGLKASTLKARLSVDLM